MKSLSITRSVCVPIREINQSFINWLIHFFSQYLFHEGYKERRGILPALKIFTSLKKVKLPHGSAKARLLRVECAGTKLKPPVAGLVGKRSGVPRSGHQQSFSPARGIGGVHCKELGSPKSLVKMFFVVITYQQF